jgi:hypothetical protein
MTTVLTLPATADSPHIEIERADGFHVSALRVNGVLVALSRYATDTLFIATDNIDDAERRIAYWQASIRQTVGRLVAGEMGDEES